MHEFQKEFVTEGSNSDKIQHHGYHRIYPWFLKHLQSKKVTLLEIGIHETESMKLWREYFGDVFVHGIDIDEKNFNDQNVQLHQVDQSKKDELDNFVKSVDKKFDVILDDGSHVPEHQILTLEHFWQLLAPGGVYIIEDIETSYWGSSKIYGYNFNTKKYNVVEYAKELINSINSEFLSSNKATSSIADEVEMVTFGYNCVVFIKKDNDSFSNYYNREYRFAGNINSHSFFHRLLNKIKRYLKVFGK